MNERKETSWVKKEEKKVSDIVNKIFMKFFRRNGKPFLPRNLQNSLSIFEKSVEMRTKKK